MFKDRKKVVLNGTKPSTQKANPDLKPTVVDFPGFKGTLPFPVAKAVNNNVNGGKLPASVQAEEKRIATAPLITPEHIKKTAVKPPEVIDFDDLTTEKKEEIKQALVDTGVAAPPKTKIEKPKLKIAEEPAFIPAHPSIAKAMRLAEKAAKEAEEQQAEPVADTPNEDHVHETETGVAASTAKCIHCGWPVGTTDPTDPTSADKQNFVVALLGQKRFTKTFELLGGKLRVVFRTLTVKENDEVIKQLVKDWNDNKISGPAHSVAEAMKYQMVLGLDSVEAAVGLVSLPEYDDYEALPEVNGTILPSVVEYVYETALTAEPLRRIVARAYGHFIDTVTKLEGMAESPDFWQATAG
jgi:hypothetical protein